MSFCKDELDKIIREYPKIKVEKFNEKCCVLRGSLNVSYTEKDYSVIEDFQIEILITDKYPHKVPIVSEIGDKIPISYSHKYSDHSLCLGTDIEILMDCKGTFTIKFLIENYIKPFLYSFRYYQRHKNFPFGDRSHNTLGLIEGYMSVFKVTSEIDALYTLETAVMENYRGHLDCLCGSNKKLRNCHPVTADILRLLKQKPHLKQKMVDDLKEIQKEVKKAHARYQRKTK